MKITNERKWVFGECVEYLLQYGYKSVDAAACVQFNKRDINILLNLICLWDKYWNRRENHININFKDIFFYQFYFFVVSECDTFIYILNLFLNEVLGREHFKRNIIFRYVWLLFEKSWKNIIAFIRWWLVCGKIWMVNDKQSVCMFLVNSEFWDMSVKWCVVSGECLKVYGE